MARNGRFRVLLDCDGVLADFVGGVCSLVERITGKRPKRSEVTEWDFVRGMVKTNREFVDLHRGITSPGFCAGLRPIAGAIDAVQELRTYADVYIVTAPHLDSPNWVPERLEWLAFHFGIAPDQVVFTPRKYLVTGDLFVDDNPGNLAAWQQDNPAGTSLLFSAPFNLASEHPRVRGWGSLLTRFRKLLKGGSR